MLTILLVDDMRHFLNLEKSFLRRSDSRLLTATTGLEAVKVAKEAHPDVIILDVEMPEMNGIEAARILKQLPETKDIPIVIVTSLNVREEALKAGADDYARKPVDEDTFLDLVRKHVDLPVRKEPRASISLDADFYLKDQKWPAILRDLSPSGCLMEADFKPLVGDLITVNFELQLDGGKKKVFQEAYVVRMTVRGFGCSFHDISTGTEIYLKEYLTSLT